MKSFYFVTKERAKLISWMYCRRTLLRRVRVMQNFMYGLPVRFRILTIVKQRWKLIRLSFFQKSIIDMTLFFIYWSLSGFFLVFCQLPLSCHLLHLSFNRLVMYFQGSQHSYIFLYYFCFCIFCLFLFLYFWINIKNNNKSNNTNIKNNNNNNNKNNNDNNSNNNINSNYNQNNINIILLLLLSLILIMRIMIIIIIIKAIILITVIIMIMIIITIITMILITIILIIITVHCVSTIKCSLIFSLHLFLCAFSVESVRNDVTVNLEAHIDLYGSGLIFLILAIS